MATLKDHNDPHTVLESLREHPAVRSVKLITSTFNEPVYLQVTLADGCADSSRLAGFMSDNNLTLSAATITSNNRLRLNIGIDE